MAAYIVARVDVRDWDAYREYMRDTPRVIQKFGGRFITRGGEMLTLEGPQETLRLVLMEFPSWSRQRHSITRLSTSGQKDFARGAGRPSSSQSTVTPSRSGKMPPGKAHDFRFLTDAYPRDL